MKRSPFAAVGLGLVVGTSFVMAQDAPPAAKPAQAKGAAAAPASANLTADASYAIGLGFGQNIKEQGLELDLNQVLAGLKDGMTAAKPRLTEAQMEQVMTAFRDQFVAQQTAKAKAVGEKNKADGAKFLAENAAKPGVKTTKSGLQYQITAEGNGPAPKATDIVKVNYRGTLLDGTEFDSSYKRNEPIEFPLNRVIPGWTEGLQLMKKGGKARLFIPSELAYGENPPGGTIGPNAVLVFDIELLDVTPAPAAAPGGLPGGAQPKGR